MPAVDGRVVHPGDQQGSPVGRPPVAAHPAHLLGRDELGQPVADVFSAVRPDQLGVGAAVEVGDPQRAVADVGDPPASRVRPRIDGRRASTRLPGTLAIAGQLGRIDLASDGEGGHREAGVGGKCHDPACLLARSLPAGSFFLRLVVPGTDRDRIDDQTLCPVRTGLQI